MDGRQQGSTKLKVYGAVVFTTRSCTAARRAPPTDVTKSSSPLTPPIPQDTPQHTLEGQNQKSPTVKFCSNMSSIITFIRKAQIKWACHVTRVPDDRIPKQLLYGEALPRQALCWWPAQAIHEQPQGLSDRFLNTHSYLGGTAEDVLALFDSEGRTKNNIYIALRDWSKSIGVGGPEQRGSGS